MTGRGLSDQETDYIGRQFDRVDAELAAMKQANEQAIAAAVEAGIMRAVSNPELWAAASAAIQSQAKARAGGLLFSWVGGFFSRAGMWIMAGIAIYMLGGWTALLAFFKSIGSQT